MTQHQLRGGGTSPHGTGIDGGGDLMLVAAVVVVVVAVTTVAVAIAVTVERGDSVGG
jgi:hypothetical protein